MHIITQRPTQVIHTAYDIGQAHEEDGTVQAHAIKLLQLSGWTRRILLLLTLKRILHLFIRPYVDMPKSNTHGINGIDNC